MTEAPTGVVADTCFRQVEFAGVLRGTDDPDGARKLIDFLVSERYQREVAMNLFVFPVNPTSRSTPRSCSSPPSPPTRSRSTRR